MPDHVPRPPKAPPDEPFVRVPNSQIRIPPEVFPPKPNKKPEIRIPPDGIRRPPVEPPRPVADLVA